MKQINLSQADKKRLQALLNKHPTYKAFSAKKADAYAFCTIFKIDVCVYCNIVPISVAQAEEKGKRPYLDHVVSQDEDSTLQLEHTNLVPSCSFCNSSLKHTKKVLDVNGNIIIIHPHNEDFDSLKVIHAVLNSNEIEYTNPKAFLIGFEDIPGTDPALIKKANKTIELFILAEQYKADFIKKEVCNMFEKMKFYSKGQRAQIYKLTDNSDDDLFTLLFPHYDCVIHKTPLGKLHRDIARQFKSQICTP